MVFVSKEGIVISPRGGLLGVMLAVFGVCFSLLADEFELEPNRTAVQVDAELRMEDLLNQSEDHGLTEPRCVEFWKKWDSRVERIHGGIGP